jgi:hypothetical protein
MELILWLYALPYDANYPVVCFDERPCFLIGELVAPLALHPGQVRKAHDAYAKLGACALLAALEPLTGKRLAQVQARRTQQEFTHFCLALAATYPDASKIRLVLDNLNPHPFAAFYTCLPAQEAFVLAQRFAFFYTPKAASWLNRIEIEFSAIARLCLDRRLASQAQLEAEVLALIAERNAKQIKINWQFSIQTARTKLNAHYRKVLPENEEYLVLQRNIARQ